MTTGINVLFTYRISCETCIETHYTQTIYDLGDPNNESALINNVCPINSAHICDASVFAITQKTLVPLPLLSDLATLTEVIAKLNQITILVNYKGRYN